MCGIKISCDQSHSFFACKRQMSSSLRTNSVPIFFRQVPNSRQIRSSSGTSRNICSTGRPFRRSALVTRFFRDFVSGVSRERRPSSVKAVARSLAASVSGSSNRLSCPEPRISLFHWMHQRDVLSDNQSTPSGCRAPGTEHPLVYWLPRLSAATL